MIANGWSTFAFNDPERRPVLLAMLDQAQRDLVRFHQSPGQPVRMARRSSFQWLCVSVCDRGA